MKKIGFIAGQDGSVVKYEPPTAVSKKLTKHQRATLYFKAVRVIDKFLQKVGFTSVTVPIHGCFVSELGGFVLEMKVEQPPRMAYITSYPGYVYDPNKVTAKVTYAGVGAGGEYVIRVIAMLPNMKTCLPIYVTVSPESTDPLREAFMSSLAAARELIGRDRVTLERIQAAMASRDVRKDFEEINQQDDEAIKKLAGPS